jgi:hypothetical protein
MRKIMSSDYAFSVCPTPNLEDQGVPLRLAPTPQPDGLVGPTSSYATTGIPLRVSGA